MKPKEEPEVPLYRVYLKDNGQPRGGKPLYLPHGPGVPLEEAERIQAKAGAETFIHCVFEPERQESE